MPKILVAYYSFSGNTRALAQEIAQHTGGVLLELVPEKAYDFRANTATKEARSQVARGHCPKLVQGNASIREYDTVFVGSPNWFNSIAPPVLSFLSMHDFAGKTLIPFCTHGGGGLGEMAEQIARACPGANVCPGFSGAEASIVQWLEQLGLTINP